MRSALLPATLFFPPMILIRYDTFFSTSNTFFLLLSWNSLFCVLTCWQWIFYPQSHCSKNVHRANMWTDFASVSIFYWWNCRVLRFQLTSIKLFRNQQQKKKSERHEISVSWTKLNGFKQVKGHWRCHSPISWSKWE